MNANLDSSWLIVKPVQLMPQWKQLLASISIITIHVFSPKALPTKDYLSSISLCTRLCTTLCILLSCDSRTVGYEGFRKSIVLMVSEEYQYATMSAYSPTLSEMPLKGKLKISCFIK